MTVKQIIGTGLTRALGTGLIADLAGDAVAGAAKAFKDHLTLNGQDLALAFQDSLSRGAAAIALGLSAEGAGVLTRLGQGTRRALAANLAQTYAARVERDFLLPYAAAQGLSTQDLQALRRQTLDLCQALTQQRTRILPPEDLDDGALAALAQGAYKGDLSTLILARATVVVPDLDPRVRGLLAHQGLLGDALLFFLRERMRSDPRVQAMLDALQREGLWADVRALKAAHAGDGPFLRLAAESHALSALIDTRLADLAGALTEVGDKLDATLAAAQGARIAAQAAGSKVDAWGGLLQDDLMGLGAQFDALPHVFVALLQRVLRPGNLGIRVTPGDEFTRHDGAARGLILQAQAELARLTPGPGYSVAALAVGSALSSTGAAAGAEALFLRAQETATSDPERTLAAYNLFQARLRQGATRFPEALAALRRAVDLEPNRYATHEEWKYPTQAILGAGGMGCAFLCREPVKGNRLVVVQTFWRAVPGTVQETFAEAMTMDRVGRGHVPALLGYGYAPGGRRPYIVMEYLEGYQIGEAWLAEHGPLPLAQGLGRGRRVLEALAAAHAAGVAHLDLKPANLLLKVHGDGIEIRVIDFGLARVAERVGGARAAGASHSGLSMLATSIAGTWDYAPPEQMGKTEYGPPGPRSDLYAFGATWYRLLSGRHPGNRRTKHLPSGCPEALFELIQDLMEHDPKDRPASAEAVIKALEGITKPVGAAFSRDVPPGAEPVRTAPAPQPVAPVTQTAPEVPDIHGWSTSQVQALQKAAAKALGRPVVFRDRLQSGGEGPEMVIIPAGRFLMGSKDGETDLLDNECQQHHVTLSGPFAIGRCAVTRGEFGAFVSASGYRTESERRGGAYGRVGKETDLHPNRSWRNPGFKQTAVHPVVVVSWNDALAYCQWLCEQTGQPYRLPTEAQWEYACRAGTQTTFSFGGNITEEEANYTGFLAIFSRTFAAARARSKPRQERTIFESVLSVSRAVVDKAVETISAHGEKGRYDEGTVRAGSLPPNPWGIYEMHGNVREWCQDWFADYVAGVTTDPVGPVTGEERVLRGGSWFDMEPSLLGSAFRLRKNPGFSDDGTGFRLALGLDPGQAS